MITLCQILAVIIVLNVLFNRKWREFELRCIDMEDSLWSKVPILPALRYIAAAIFLGWGVYALLDPEQEASIFVFILLTIFAVLTLFKSSPMIVGRDILSIIWHLLWTWRGR